MIRICKTCGKEFEAKQETTFNCRSCTQKLANYKRQQTTIRRYGVKNIMDLPEYRQKILDTTKERYGVEHYAQTDKFKEDFQKHMTEKYGVPYYVMTDEWNNNKHFKISAANRKAYSILDEYNISYTREFPLEQKEYDIAIEGCKLLIEIDPSYTHNIIGNHWNSKGLDPNYHLQKTLLAEKYGYDCIHIFDFDNLESIITYISQMLTCKNLIRLEDCSVSLEQDSESNSLFMKMTNPCDVEIGKYNVRITYNENTCAMCSFTKRDENFELVSFCQSPTVQFSSSYVSKCIQFTKQQNPNCTITTVGDVSKVPKRIYSESGFLQTSVSSPSMIWTKGSSKQTSIQDEKQMLTDGWLPIFDCGHIEYEHGCTTSAVSSEIPRVQDDFSFLTDIKNSIHKSKTKICAFCGKEFIPNSSFQKYCKGPHYRKCPVCGKEYLEDNSENLKRPPVACSYACRTERRKQTSLERYGITAPGNTPEARKKAMKKSHETRELAKDPQGYIRNAAQNASLQALTLQEHNSNVEFGNQRVNEFTNSLTNRSIKFESEFRLENYSYDFHIIDTNILVEIDPTYTHNVIGNHRSNGVEYDYHLKKSNVAKEHGFRCIHVFDWDDLDKICDMLLPKTRIRAHDTDIWILTNEFTNQFLKKYHLQGSCRGHILSLGLFKDGTCYMVMSFGRSRYNPNYDVELLRMCSLPGYSVLGGASKLFNYAVNTYELYSIISYCDYSKFSGDVYKEMGMELIRTNRPQEVWSKDNKKVTANLLRQHGYDQLFHTSYGKQKSNQVLMLEHEWLPVFDCGQQVWRFKR